MARPRYDRRAALYTAIGIDTGAVVWGLIAAVGIAGVLRASALAFTVLKLLGAAYLCFLGLQALWHSFRGDAGRGHLATAGSAADSILSCGHGQRSVLQN